MAAAAGGSSPSDDLRIVLYRELKDAAERASLNMTDEAVEVFANRAANHIETRFESVAARREELQGALASLVVLIANLSKSPVVTQNGLITTSDVREFVEKDTSCFYPWCRPG